MNFILKDELLTKKNKSRIFQFGIEGEYFFDLLFKNIEKENRVIYKLGNINLVIFFFPTFWYYFLVYRSLKVAYFKTIFSFLNITKVITWLDNNQTFQLLDKKIKDIKFIAFQNGYRSNFDLSEKKIFHSNFVCFGKNEINRYKKYGHKVNNFYNYGSLKLNLIINNIKNNQINIKRYEKNFSASKICIIDELPDNLIKKVKYPEKDSIRSPKHRIEANIKMLEYVSIYCLEKKVIPNIILRYPSNLVESKNLRKIYKSIFKNNLNILYNDKYFLKSYIYSYLSSILLGLRSTLLIESFSIGKKILSCNYSKDKNFEFPRKGFYYLERDDTYNEFKNKFEYIMSMNKKDWLDKTIWDRKYIMTLSNLEKYKNIF